MHRNYLRRSKQWQRLDASTYIAFNVRAVIHDLDRAFFRNDDGFLRVAHAAVEVTPQHRAWNCVPGEAIHEVAANA